MSSSDSSSLSEPLASDDERIKRKPSPKLTLKLKNGKLDFGRRAASPKSSPDPSLVDLGREPTPPHEYVLADNPDIAVSIDSWYCMLLGVFAELKMLQER